MRAILSDYLRTLRERDEFDRLLPDLLTDMGFLPLVRPQAGIRQFGVDFPAVGKSTVDGADELRLFVIKQGDISRRVWSGDPNNVRESMEEILDAYLRSHVPPPYTDYRKVIVLATTGDMNQDIQPNWAGFLANHPEVAFEFWGADRVAGLLEQHMLNERLFDGQDRSALRRSLALAGDSEYRFPELCQLLLRQLGLDKDGALSSEGGAQEPRDVLKAFQRAHLAARICAHWAQSQGERRQAVWVMERLLLWCFHRAQLQQLHKNPKVRRALMAIWKSHVEIGQLYFGLFADRIHVRDGLSGYCREGAEYGLVLFEQVSLISSIGLAQAATDLRAAQCEPVAANALHVAQALGSILRNHAAAASPRLDNHAIDISLALTLFNLSGQHDVAQWWLSELIGRLNLVFRMNREFPVGTDLLDDLAELQVNGDGEFKRLMKQTSWLLATVASWAAMLEHDAAYAVLAEGHAQDYPEVGGQLWHPEADWSARWYFGPSHYRRGATEAPYQLPPTAAELRDRIRTFNDSRRLQWEEHSPALEMGLWAIDFVACRHFRTPVPASVWYHIRSRKEASKVSASDDGHIDVEAQ